MINKETENKQDGMLEGAKGKPIMSEFSFPLGLVGGHLDIYA